MSRHVCETCNPVMSTIEVNDRVISHITKRYNEVIKLLGNIKIYSEPGAIYSN